MPPPLARSPECPPVPSPPGSIRYFQYHAPGRTLAWDHQMVILCSVIVALTFAIIWLLNAWGAERLQRRIDQLDKLRAGPE